MCWGRGRRPGSRSWRCSCRRRPRPRPGRSRPGPRRDRSVGLEVAGRLVEAVVVRDVVEPVVAVEEVRHDGFPVVLGVLVEVGREVEREARASVRAAAEVGGFAVVLIEVRMRVVPLRRGELRARGAVRVVPAKRRGDRIGRVRDDLPRRVVRALGREREHVVARAVVHLGGRRCAGRGARAGDGAVARALERRELAERVLGRPVVRVEQPAILGVDGGVPGLSPAESSITSRQASRRPLSVGASPDGAGSMRRRSRHRRRRSRVPARRSR